jgi:hypothetical protein
MTTRINVPRTHRVQPVLWIVAMLLVSVVASGKSTQASRCPEQKTATEATGAAPATVWRMGGDAVRQAASDLLPAETTSTGLDLEVRIWNVRIGFPWLKSLPLTPGRRIVLSLWDTAGAGAGNSDR